MELVSKVRKDKKAPEGKPWEPEGAPGPETG